MLRLAEEREKEEAARAAARTAEELQRSAARSTEEDDLMQDTPAIAEVEDSKTLEFFSPVNKEAWGKEGTMKMLALRKARWSFERLAELDASAVRTLSYEGLTELLNAKLKQGSSQRGRSPHRQEDREKLLRGSTAADVSSGTAGANEGRGAFPPDNG